MNAIFYVAGAVAVVATLLAMLQRNTVHALLYVIVALLATSLIFFSLGAPYVAALQIVVYSGAIMVLFIFVIMMLNVAPTPMHDRGLLNPWPWIGPSLLAGVLLAESVLVVRGQGGWLPGTQATTPKEVSLALFGPYMLVVELASLLLLAGLVGAYHIGRREPQHLEGARR